MSNLPLLLFILPQSRHRILPVSRLPHQQAKGAAS
jgi:hypothetical protein